MGSKERSYGSGITHPRELLTPSGIILERTEIDGTTYVAPTWEEMGDFTEVLARQINTSGEAFDLIIPIANGGLTWSRHLSGLIGVGRITPIEIRRYRGVNNAGKPDIIQPLPDRIDGKLALLFDEVIDEGVTIEAGIDHVIEKGAADVKIATLCYKPHAQDITGVTADYSAFETNDWVAFPHETEEFIKELALTWLSPPHDLPIDEVKNRLLQIGMQKKHVEKYVNPFNNLEIQTELDPV